VDEVKKSVNEWKNYKKRLPSRVSQGARAPRGTHVTRNVYSQLLGLEDVVFNGFIKDDFIPEGNGQLVSGSVSLPVVTLYPWRQERTLEREQNERDVLEALDEYKCTAGISFENVSVVVNIKTLKPSLQSSIGQKRIDGLKN
jgi:hypothetical protein